MYKKQDMEIPTKEEKTMRYRILLFDADNTILDFDANEKASFFAMMQEMGETCTEEIYQTYAAMNRRLWQAIERGEITVKEGINTRFARLMAGYGREVDGPLYESVYRSYLNQGSQVIPEAEEALTDLQAAGYELYLITNGMEETQNFRMKASGMDRFFRDRFISSRIGANKPSAEFFAYVKEHIPDFDGRKTLIIGDSLTSDIQGGLNAGLDTCWYNREGKTPDPCIPATYEIRDLRELKSITEG